MSVSNGKITAPVSITDVRTAIGDSSYDLATLCSSNKIRQWSQYKPIRKSGISLDAGDWYRGNHSVEQISGFLGLTSGQNVYWLHSYSIKFLAFSSLNDMVKHMVDSADNAFLSDYNGQWSAYNNWDFWDNNFSYEKPTGGADSPYRLGDFRNYSNKAKCGFYTGFTADPSEIKSANDLQRVNAQSDLQVPILVTLTSLGGSPNGDIGIYELVQRFSNSVKFVSVPIFKPSAPGVTYWQARTNVPTEYSQTITADRKTFTNKVKLIFNGDTGFPISSGNKVVGIANCLQLNSVSLGNGVTKTLYVPLSQVGGGSQPNTETYSGETFSLQFFNMMVNPVGNMSVIAICKYPQGVSSGWITIQSFIGSAQTIGSSLSIKMRAPKYMDTYQVTNANFKFELSYKITACPSDASRVGEQGVLWIDGSTTEGSKRIRVKGLANDSAAPSQTPDFVSTTVTVPTSSNYTYIEVSLPQMLTVITGQPNLAGCSVIINHMVIWHGNTLASKTWSPMTSESLTMNVI